MPPNIRFIVGLIALLSFGTALIMLIQLPFRAIGWVRLHSDWYAPIMEEIILGGVGVGVVCVGLLWFSGRAAQDSSERGDTGSCVWVSAAKNDSRLSRHLSYPQLEEDEDAAIEQIKRSARGLPLAPQDVPQHFTDLTVFDDDHPQSKHPGDLVTSGFLVMSRKMATIFLKHDLGDSRVPELDAIYHKDGTPHPQDYNLLLVAETKEAFVPEQCNQDYIKQFAAPVMRWIVMVHDAKDDDFAVSRAALDGPDLWIDPKAPQVHFMSDRLYQALRQAGLSHWWDAKRCRVVDA